MSNTKETGILRVDSARRVVPEPVAIIGMGARFPGASDVGAFWKILAEGSETVGEYPGGRFPYIDEVYSPDSAFAARIASRRGGFLSGLDQFDAEFFGISPREAALLDPQQRLLLEVAWEAVDDAGLVREKLAGTRTGVFVGMWTNDYEDCLYEASPDVDFHATTGSGRYAASGRLAYFLDLRGPNLTLDTACSSSLVAIHLACQSLRAGECGIALAGGANAILRPEITLVYSDAGMLAPDGRCKFGDASADGYVRSEGAGIVILKRLSDAVTDGDSIYAVIRGSAVNNDGNSSGLLVSPSRKGQEDVIRSALEYAGVGVDEVAYIEAHGTGTLAGDPVEIETIGRVMASATRTYPCAIGSLKTNIGHTESAAGVAGVMKVALALDRGLVPASLHFNEPSPQIPWRELPLVVPIRSMQWPDSGRMPVAGVTGIGITGTNAHVVLQGAATSAPTPVARDSSSRPFLFLLSAQTGEALRAVAASWNARLESDTSWPSSLADLAYTAAVRHSHHDYRLALTASDRDDLTKRLDAWLRGDELPGVVFDRRLQLASGKAVFVYPGQGGQWLGMGRTLFDREPVFRDALLRCDAAIAKHAGWSVVDELRATPETTRLDEIDIVQPTLFAVMVALTDLLRSLGIEPSAVVGHSMGEVAAAAVAGALSLDDAAAVICHRSRLMKRSRGRGAMAVVELSVDETREMIGNAERIWIGASNGATSTVISGDVDSIEAMIASLDAREIFCRRIKVDVASHSGHMDAVRDELESSLSHIQPRVGQLPIYSTATGEIEDGSRLDAAYWGRNLRQTVLFHPAVQRLLADGFDAFVEINAHPVLTHSLSDSVELSGRDAVVTGSLRRDADEQVELLSTVGKLHAAGFPVNFRQMYPDGVSLRLPVYPWQRERHWFDYTPGPYPRIERHVSSTRVEHALADVVDCVNEIVWADAPVPDVGALNNRERGDWILFADGPVGDGLAVQFASLGDTCTIIRRGSEFRAIDERTFDVDPASEDDMRRALVDRLENCRGVVHAWSASPRDGKEPDLDELWAAQSSGCFSVACLVRVLANLAMPRPVRLWLVTAGLHRESSTAPMPFPTHGAMNGIGRAIAQEHPELQCTNVDLSAAPTEQDLRATVLIMREDLGEQQMLVRSSRRLVARYRRTETDRALSIRSDATYVITGGLGGVGRLVAQWLASRGARSLVLVGRSAPSTEAVEFIRSIEAKGAAIRVARADVADMTDVSNLVSIMSADIPPIRGVFHLAATVDDRLLANATEDSYRRLLRPKMAGAWNIYHAVNANALDFWVSFSSIAAVVSQPGQGAYSAANAFLDSMAHYVSSRGGRMQSLQWGPWADTGLAHEAGTQRSFRAYVEQGIQPMTQDMGVAILEYALTQSAPVALTAMADWSMLVASSSAQAIAPEFSELVNKSPVAPVLEPDLREQLSALPSARQRGELLEAHIREQLAAVLKTSPQRIDRKKPLGSMGVDSLLALELVRRLSRSLGVKIPATAVFNYPTVAKLLVHVQSRMAAADDHSTRATPSATIDAPAIGAVPVTSIQAMSDEDALRSLMGENGSNR